MVIARQRLLIFGLLLAALLGAAWFLWHQLSGTSPSLDTVYESMDVEIKDMHLTQGGRGQRTWELQASESRYIRDESRIEFDRPRITFYKQDQGRKITAEAPSGEYLQDEGTAELWPEVTASYGQITVHSQRMILDQEKQTVTFTQNVRIVHPRSRAVSNRAVIDLEKDRLVLIGNVEVDLDADFLQ